MFVMCRLLWIEYILVSWCFSSRCSRNRKTLTAMQLFLSYWISMFILASTMRKYYGDSPTTWPSTKICLCIYRTSVMFRSMSMFQTIPTTERRAIWRRRRYTELMWKVPYMIQYTLCIGCKKLHAGWNGTADSTSSPQWALQINLNRHTSTVLRDEVG